MVYFDFALSALVGHYQQHFPLVLLCDGVVGMGGERGVRGGRSGDQPGAEAELEEKQEERRKGPEEEV